MATAVMITPKAINLGLISAMADAGNQDNAIPRVHRPTNKLATGVSSPITRETPLAAKMSPIRIVNGVRSLDPERYKIP
jgi:hypothetical protein